MNPSAPPSSSPADTVVLLDGCRTAFQKAATGFFDLMSYQLAAATVRGLADRNGLGADSLDRVVFGATVHNPATTNVAREALLHAGLSATVPGVTVTAAGASANVALEQAVQLIRSGQAQAVIAGGTDCVSDPPIGYSRTMRKKLLRGRRARTPWQKLRLLLGLRPWDFLPDMPEVREFTTGETMGQYTERLARSLDISRAAQDAYAARSHRRADAARSHHAVDIVPVAEAPDALEDNGVRPSTSPESLADLPAAFRDGGTLTAGNSTFLTDGAAAVLVASAEWAQEHGHRPLAIVRDVLLTAHDPREELLLGPVFAIPRLLDRHALWLTDLDVVEIHEAFAAQILAVLHHLASGDLCRQLLGRDAVGILDVERLNAWGGSLALGNPFAPNGARLVTTAARRLEAGSGRWAAVATCAGGGLGSAVLLERPLQGPKAATARR